MRKRIKSDEEIKADRWIEKHNRSVRLSDLTKREKEKLLVPKLNAPFLGRTEEKPFKAKKQKKKKPYWKKPKPDIIVPNKLDEFENMMKNHNDKTEYWDKLVQDLDAARLAIKTDSK